MIFESINPRQLSLVTLCLLPDLTDRPLPRAPEHHGLEGESVGFDEEPRPVPLPLEEESVAQVLALPRAALYDMEGGMQIRHPFSKA